MPSVLLEPIMKVEVAAPKDCIGAIFRDLNLRRGRVEGQDKRSDITAINALVLLMNRFGYASSLRSISRGSQASAPAGNAARGVPGALRPAPPGLPGGRCACAGGEKAE